MSTKRDTQKLTPEQQKALATDKNISVTAGAGSGKTTILVDRYLKILLEDKVDIRQLLAITFTEKAAAEMTERVSRIINQKLNDPQAKTFHPRLLELRGQLNSAQISTIHAFCAKILREFAVASGVDPDFAVVNEFQRDLLISESIEETLSDLNDRSLQSPYDDESWKELLRQIPPANIEEILSTAVRQPYETSLFEQRMAQFSDEEILSGLENRFFNELKKYIAPSQFLDQVLSLLQKLNAIPISVENLKESGEQLFAVIEKILALKRHFENDPQLWQYLMELAKLSTKDGQPYKALTGIGNKKDLGKAYPLLFELSEMMAPVGMFCLNVFATAPAEQDALHLQALRQISFLYQVTTTRYREKKAEHGLLDFDDLQLLSLEMLQNHPTVCSKLRNRYRYIMVDEFQDTNLLQWEIISLLGVLDGELQEDKFFVVGDPKQSIYGFRNADVRVFQQVKEQFAKKQSADKHYPGNIALKESFRFLPPLNQFVNYLFGQVLAEDSEDEFSVTYEELDTRRQAEEAAHIEIAFLEESTLTEQHLLQEDYIARKIKDILHHQVQVYHRSQDGEVLEPVLPGDIAILIPRRTHLTELESKLRQYGIPFKTIGGVGFYQRQEIYDVYHLLRYLENQDDDLALVALLRSPFAGISDAGLFYLVMEKGNTYRKKLMNISEDSPSYPELDRKQLLRFRTLLHRWIHRRDRLPLSHLLKEIFEESFYRAIVAAEWNGEQIQANLDKIINFAQEFEQGGFIALADFIDSLHQLIQQDPREGEAQIALEDERTVKVMTIHQAKGLEFPVVFCPYLQQKLPNNRSRTRVDSELGLAVKIRDPQNQYQETTPFLYELIDRREKQKQRAEWKRLFYVAVTRARDRVYLVGTYSKNLMEDDNCLAWCAQSLQVDPQTFSENALYLDHRLKVHIAYSLDDREVPSPEKLEVEENWRELEETLSKPPEKPVYIPAHYYPLKDQPERVTFSATQLLTFAANPQNYFRRYHLGFFESDYEFVKQITDPDNISLLKGKIIHKILENGIPKKDKELHQKLEQAYFQFEVFDDELQEQLQTEIPKLLRSFSQSPFAQRIFSASRWKNEISLTMKLSEDYFTGTLDRIFLNSNGYWEVADFKTNNIRESEVKKTGEKYLMQMKSYAMLMAQLFPGQTDFPVSLYFLVPEREFSRAFSSRQIKEIKQEFTQLINQIKQYYPFGEKGVEE